MTNKINFIFLLILSIILTSCDNANNTPDDTVTSTESTVVSAVRIPTETIIPSPIPPSTTASMTAIPIPTLSESTPSQPPLPTKTATLTSLEGEALDTAIAELIADPMNCDVPCWWGAIPNETTGFEVQQFLNLYQFTTYIEYEDEKPDFPSSIEVWVGFEGDENSFDFRVFYGFTNNILQGVYSERNPLLHDILARYGQPDEVWLETMDFEPPGGLPFRLNLVYLQAGLAVGYVVDGDLEDDVAIGCFAGEERGRLQLNIPNEITNYMDFRWVFEVDRRYLPLEDATELTMKDFMQRFIDISQPQCIETPAELWE